MPGQGGPLAGIEAADMERVGQVARLYLLVHRRPPDAGGLAANVRVLREGRQLADLAAEFLASGEFTSRVAAGHATQEIWRNAGEVDGLPPRCGRLAEDLARLIMCDAVIARLPLLPALMQAGSQRVSFVMALMRGRWGDALDRDPFWSPNLRPGEGPDEIEPRRSIE